MHSAKSTYDVWCTQADALEFYTAALQQQLRELQQLQHQVRHQLPRPAAFVTFRCAAPQCLPSQAMPPAYASTVSTYGLPMHHMSSLADRMSLTNTGGITTLQRDTCGMAMCMMPFFAVCMHVVAGTI